MLWLVLWYLFCAALICLFLFVFHLLTRPSFRSDFGDITTEVGYEEDPTGCPLDAEHLEVSESEVADPHIMTSGNAGSGLM
ncbi:MAG: hypothetical protein HY711_07150 [Candidatus Melainabacteria bacterium]|nr:hypothetical protein [Candidatus Melainabacteria bacterium]